MSLWFSALFIAQGWPSALFDTTTLAPLCASAMTDAAEGCMSGAEDSPTEQSGAASAAPAAPRPAPREPSSAGSSSSSVLEEKSGLLEKI